MGIINVFDCKVPKSIRIVYLGYVKIQAIFLQEDEKKCAFSIV